MEVLRFPNHPSVFNRISGNLWMGEYPSPDYDLSQYFDCLVLAAREYQISECFKLKVICAPLKDDEEPMTKLEMVTAVKAAAEVINCLKKNQRVLVTCWAGRNRSGLITAMALCKGPNQMPLKTAITLIRMVRGRAALSNQSFVRFLVKLCS